MLATLDPANELYRQMECQLGHVYNYRSFDNASFSAETLSSRLSTIRASNFGTSSVTLSSDGDDSKWCRHRQLMWRHRRPSRCLVLTFCYPTWTQSQLDDCIVWNAICARDVYFLHSTMPSVACLRIPVDDVRVMCHVTYFQFPILSAFLPYRSPGSTAA